jgi:signal peptidase II
VLFGLLCWWIRSLDKARKASTGVLVGLTLITAGALGNIIDCLFYGLIWDYAPFMFGKVVDMFYFPLIHNASGDVVFFSPVFNFADSCVTVGAFYLLLFHWRFFVKE